LEMPATSQQGGWRGCCGRATPGGCHVRPGSGRAWAIACGFSEANTKITGRQGYRER
jgi:hypothetical protein